MRKISLLACACAVQVLSGCWLPIDMRPDASVTDASVTDASVTDGSVSRPTCEGPLTLPNFLPGQMLGPITVTIDGCAPNVSVLAPDGSPLSTEVGVVAVAGKTVISFVATTFGPHVLRLGPADGGHQDSVVEVIESFPEDGGILRRYADRIDECVVRALSDEGRLFCDRGTTVWVYEADGGLSTQFEGTPYRTVVLGNEVWTMVAGIPLSVGGTPPAIEHRTDTPAGLRFDGSTSIPGLNLDWFGETQPGRTVVATSDTVVELTWDGEKLSRNHEFKNLATNTPLLVDGDTAWGADLCTYAPGCENLLCTPVVNCPFGDGFIAGFDNGAVWVMTDRWLSLWSRPLANHRVLKGPRWVPSSVGDAQFPLFFTRLWLDPWAFAAGSPLWGSALFPVEDQDGFHFALKPLAYWPQIGEKWILTTVDPMTLRITHR